MYLKSKIAEVHRIPDDGGNSSNSSDGLASGIARSLQLKSKLMKSPYHAIDSVPAHGSATTESKVSVYYTPNDSADQQQLQLSPMHINFMRENLNTYTDCIKPSASLCKFDVDMHRLEANLEKEIDRRRRHLGLYPEDDEDEIIEINTEHTRMLNSDDSNLDNIATNSNQTYIRLNTLPKRNRCQGAASGKDLYYSLENVFDPVAVTGNLYGNNLSNKTIDEASETQMTSSASDNCSSTSNNLSRSNPTNDESSDEHQHPSESVLVVNEVTPHVIDELHYSKSMPNICKTEQSTKDQSLDTDTDNALVNHEHSQLDQMLPNETPEQI